MIKKVLALNDLHIYHKHIVTINILLNTDTTCAEDSYTFHISTCMQHPPNTYYYISFSSHASLSVENIRITEYSYDYSV